MKPNNLTLQSSENPSPLRNRRGSLAVLTLQTACAAGLLAAITGPASATVTPYFYLKGGDSGNSRIDSTPGSTRAFTSAFSISTEGVAQGGQDRSIIWPLGAGGPLGGAAGPLSTVSTRWGFFNTRTSGMWIENAGGPPTAAQWSIPAQNWVMEGWVLPVGTGTTPYHAASKIACVFSNGSGHQGAVAGGVRLRIGPGLDEFGNFSGEQTVFLEDIARTMENPASTEENPLNPITRIIGDPVLMDNTKWNHYAAVNENGVLSFYVNGVKSGDSSPADSSPPGGTPFVGSGQDTQQPFNGYTDELRWSTFEPGQFQVSDLLTRPPGPSIVATPPAAVSVWEGGAAPFGVEIAYDETATWQWKLGGTAVEGATATEYLIPSVVPADTDKVFSAAITSGGVTVTSSGTTLTVSPVKTEDTAYYRAAVQEEASLVAYFPVDGDTAQTATNAKNAALNGTLDEGVSYDGRTNRSLGQRALRFKENGGVTLPPNGAFEFPGGTGTLEAIIYLDTAGTQGEATIFSVSDDVAAHIEFRASVDGNTLICDNDVLDQSVTWLVQPSLRGRHAHVAFVITGKKVTAYVDGVSLGQKDLPSFGSTTGLPARIGAGAPDAEGVARNPWKGTIDELAVYTAALSANSIGTHASRFKFGTAVTAPEITSQTTGPFNVLAGGAPVLRVTNSGTFPLTYQWKRNGADVTGNPTATTSTLVLNNSTLAMAGEYTVTVSNPQGSDTSDPVTVNFTAPPDSYSTFVLQDNPSAYWRVNETTGTTMKDYAGGLDGTYGPTVTLDADPLTAFDPDPALRLNGNGNAAVPFSPVLNPTGAFSVEAWVKPTVSGASAARAVYSSQDRNAGRAGYVLYQGLNANAGWEFHFGVAETVKNLSSGVVPEAGRWDHVVATWDGAATARLYVNGVQRASHVNNGDAASGPVRPNLTMPFEIGSRFGGGIPWDGNIDEIAFYNHALTQEQINRHHSVTWIPPVITQDLPATAGAVEAGTLTLTAQATGYPNTYQWLKDGEPLVADGRFPQGVNSLTLVINGITPEDAGSYQLVVQHPGGDKTSVATTVSYVLDTTPPVVVEAAADGSLRRVRLRFDKPVTPETAGLLANYALSGGLTASSVMVTANPAIVDVVLTTPLTPGAAYTVGVSGVRDQRTSNNLLVPASSAFTAPVITPGVIPVNFYGGIAGNNVEDLRADLQYPDGVWHTSLLSSFSTSGLTAQPELVALGLADTYGSHVHGWITPSVSGSYTFFLDSDDGAELYISTDADPAKVDLKAFVTECCKGFLEPGETVIQTSDPIDLVAGQSYYIEAFQKEGGGGDFVRVAWRIAGDTTPAANLAPIPGTFLSGYAVIPITGIGTPVVANGQVTITWEGAGVLQHSDDLLTWTDVPGNPTSPYVTPVATKKFYRLMTETP